MSPARRALLAGSFAVSVGCVFWPAGTGPGAPEMPLAEALERCNRGQAVLIDVRSPSAYARGHVPGALNMPAHTLEARAGEIRRMGRLPILYCG